MVSTCKLYSSNPLLLDHNTTYLNKVQIPFKNRKQTQQTLKLKRVTLRNFMQNLKLILVAVFHFSFFFVGAVHPHYAKTRSGTRSLELWSQKKECHTQLMTSETTYAINGNSCIPRTQEYCG